jgi:hypothetical protein
MRRADLLQVRFESVIRKDRLLVDSQSTMATLPLKQLKLVVPRAKLLLV